MLACGVCGSDVLDSWVARKVPAVLGHELCAEVEAVGAGVPRRRAGRPRRRPPPRAVRRVPALPPRPRDALRAVPRDGACDPGGFAERVRVPAELVGELLVVGEPRRRARDVRRAAGLRPARVRPLRAARRATACSSSATGTSGLLAVAAAHARAVDAVWVREPRAERLERALALGAERHGNELVDVALVCTTQPAAIADGFAAVAPGGALCLYAPPDPGQPLDLDGHALYVGEVDVCASYSAGPRRHARRRSS